MQCDVTTIVCQADLADKGRQTETGNPISHHESSSNYRVGTTASARRLFKRLRGRQVISGAAGKKYKPKKSGTVLVGFWVRSVDLVVLASDYTFYTWINHIDYS